MKWIARKIKAAYSRIRRLPKRVIIPGIIVILGLFAFGGYKAVAAYNYMQNNPEFCRTCHIMDEAWDRWYTSEHRSVNCHECHEQGLVQSTQLLLKYAFRLSPGVPSHAVVPPDVCVKCHESGNPRWVQVAATAGHKVHAEEQHVSCIKCHSVTLHRFEPPGPICSICHEEKQIEISGMAEMHCASCHDFLAEVSLPLSNHELLPSRKSCLDCHQALTGLGVTWPEDAPMQFPCGDCHQPHEQAKPTVDCLSCHPDVRTQGMHTNGSHAASECQTCHKPHQWQVEGRETCLTCHPGRAEHNSGIECAACHSFQ